MANETHKIKLLVLWDILCKYTDETHHLNTDEIKKCSPIKVSTFQEKFCRRI